MSFWTETLANGIQIEHPVTDKTDFIEVDPGCTLLTYDLINFCISISSEDHNQLPEPVLDIIKHIFRMYTFIRALIVLYKKNPSDLEQLEKCLELFIRVKVATKESLKYARGEVLHNKTIKEIIKDIYTHYMEYNDVEGFRFAMQYDNMVPTNSIVRKLVTVKNKILSLADLYYGNKPHIIVNSLKQLCEGDIAKYIATNILQSMNNKKTQLSLQLISVRLYQIYTLSSKFVILQKDFNNLLQFSPPMIKQVMDHCTQEFLYSLSKATISDKVGQLIIKYLHIFVEHGEETFCSEYKQLYGDDDVVKKDNKKFNSGVTDAEKNTTITSFPLF